MSVEVKEDVFDKPMISELRLNSFTFRYNRYVVARVAARILGIHEQTQLLWERKGKVEPFKLEALGGVKVWRLDDAIEMAYRRMRVTRRRKEDRHGPR